MTAKDSGRNCREAAALCPVFKKHANFVESDRDRRYQTATKRRGFGQNLAWEIIGAIMILFVAAGNQPGPVFWRATACSLASLLRQSPLPS